MHSLIAMSAEFKKFDITPALQEINPNEFLGVLTAEQIKPLESNPGFFKIAAESEVSVDGPRYDGHRHLATGPLREDVIVKLLEVGRNVNNPNNTHNVVGLFDYDPEVESAFRKSTGLRIRRAPMWARKKTPAQLFFIRHNYFGQDKNKINLYGIEKLHIVANLPEDPRNDLRHPSIKFRFRVDYR